MTEQTEEYITLKFGSFKSWNFNNEETFSLFKKYCDLGMSESTMTQNDTDEQKDLICQIIDRIDCEHIHNDWEGTEMTKDEAKKYVMEYGK